MALSVQLRELAERILALGAGVERANAKHDLAYLVTTNLPTIIAALEAQEKNDAT